MPVSNRVTADTSMRPCTELLSVAVKLEGDKVEIRSLRQALAQLRRVRAVANGNYADLALLTWHLARFGFL